MDIPNRGRRNVGADMSSEDSECDKEYSSEDDSVAEADVIEPAGQIDDAPVNNTEEHADEESESGGSGDERALDSDVGNKDMPRTRSGRQVRLPVRLTYLTVR